MIITIWQRYNKDDEGNWKWEHNHISNGWNPDQPLPLSKFSDVQRGWNGCKWRKFEGTLKNGVVWQKNEL